MGHDLALLRSCQLVLSSTFHTFPLKMRDDSAILATASYVYPALEFVLKTCQVIS